MLSTFALATLALSVAAQRDSYAPSLTTCPPADQLLRLAGKVRNSNQTLSTPEQSYITQRKETIVPLWQQYLTARNIGYDQSSFTNASSWPTLGIAVSGGGYRAALYGAGTLSALDSRNATSAQVGTGGVLQLASYLSGLSGGSWAVSSWSIYDAPLFSELVLGNGANLPGWQLQYNLIAPGGTLGFFTNDDYYDNLQADVDLKEAAGFNTSITDIWGRGLSYHFAPGTENEDSFSQRDSPSDHGAGLLFSSITSRSNFTSHNMPFPIIVADSVLDDQSTFGNPLTEALVLLNQTVFEMNPYEMGSYDDFLSAFVNITYLGTNLNAGVPPNNTACAVGFDNFGFLIGTSSSLFDAILSGLDTANTSGFARFIQVILQRLTNGLSEEGNSVANYPNPFQGINPEQFARANSRNLQLVDGGLNGENVPVGPLLTQARGVDVLIAMDGSADTDQNWPNGTSIITTQLRTQLPDLQGTYSLPSVPESADTWVTNGFAQRPTFFGCNGTGNDSAPLLIYWPNRAAAGVSPSTNTTTLKLDYSLEEAASFLAQAQENGYRGFTNDQAAGSRDENWGNCLACALMDRARDRAGVARSSVCSTCFDTYCYNPATAVVASATNEGPRSAASRLEISALALAAVSIAAMVF